MGEKFYYLKFKPYSGTPFSIHNRNTLTRSPIFSEGSVMTTTAQSTASWKASPFTAIFCRNSITMANTFQSPPPRLALTFEPSYFWNHPTDFTCFFSNAKSVTWDSKGQ
eukprot:Lithocolla_globosa_v1_NODE_2554_length_1956_cov_4.129406.p2 type:complete len:109 gc:universal NODE_2554_length_1956_cov_4.129406:1954-1628(-)